MRRNGRVNSFTNASLNETLWALTDHKGTVRELADDSGTVVNHVQYDSVGNVIAESNSTKSSLVKYNGKPLEETSGNYWMRAQWYDPGTSRWLSQDFVWDGTNQFAFVGNEVTTHIDPDGLQKIPWSPFGVGGPYMGRLTTPQMMIEGKNVG